MKASSADATGAWGNRRMRIPGRIARCLFVAAAAAGLATFEASAEQTTAVSQLGWLRIGEYAPILIAEAMGFFNDEGIEHKTLDGGPGKNPIPIVAVGQAQFGLAANGMTIV